MLFKLMPIVFHEKIVGFTEAKKTHSDLSRTALSDIKVL